MSVVENISITEPKMKRARQSDSDSESEIEGNEDRLSDLPDCILLHILSFLKCKDVVRTCVLSTRWNHLWKRLPSLVLHSSDFGTLKRFTKFVSKVLSLRDGSLALHTFDFERSCHIEPHILKRVISYATSHNVQQLGIDVQARIDELPPSIFSLQTLTSLMLSVYPIHLKHGRTLFPKSLSLAALTNLHLCHFEFCASENDQAEPFSACHRLNNLVIDNCALRDAQILCISSTTLSSLTIRFRGSDFYKIVLSAPNLRSFVFEGVPSQLLSGSCLPSLEQVNIDAFTWCLSLESPLILLSWLIELASVQSLTVSSNTLQVLFLIPGLLNIKLPSLRNLKSLKVEMKPLSLIFAMTRPGPCKTREDKMKRYLPTIPDGILDFLLQNSPSAEVTIIKR